MIVDSFLSFSVVFSLVLFFITLISLSLKHVQLELSIYLNSWSLSFVP